MKHTRIRAATRSHPESGLALAFLALLTLLVLIAAPARAGVCVDEIVKAEQDFKLPRGVMLAVALVETGAGGTPVPFAVNVKGRAIMASTELAAARTLRDQHGNLRSSVYAGCMQLSVTHHKAAFSPVERIVNPAENVRYAAKFLLRLRAESGSWPLAVARYNGSTGKTAHAYQCRIRQGLVGLGAAETASLFDGRSCPATDDEAVAPRTRRTFLASTQPVG